MKRLLARSFAGSKHNLRNSSTDSMALSESSLAPSATVAEDAECRADWGLALAEEWQLVQQLRDEIEMEAGPLQPEFDDFALRRFLRARKHNILKAKQMFLEQLKWRKAAHADTVLTDFHFYERDEFAKWYPEAFFGVDREGRPIYLQQPGKIDTDQLWKFTTLERCIRYHISQQERYWRIIAPCASIACGRRHEQSLVLIDMEGVGISTLTGEVRKIMAQIMQIDQDYYPELMWKCVIINAPTTFRVIWGMVKYLMDARTQAKIEVLGASYQEELLRLVAPEHLPQQYGGTCTAPLTAGPGPWQDPEVLAQLEQQRQQRIADTGRPAGMTVPEQLQAARGAGIGSSGQVEAAEDATPQAPEPATLAAATT